MSMSTHGKKINTQSVATILFFLFFLIILLWLITLLCLSGATKLFADIWYTKTCWGANGVCGAGNKFYCDLTAFYKGAFKGNTQRHHNNVRRFEIIHSHPLLVEMFCTHTSNLPCRNGEIHWRRSSTNIGFRSFTRSIPLWSQRWVRRREWPVSDTIYK